MYGIEPATFRLVTQCHSECFYGYEYRYVEDV